MSITKNPPKKSLLNLRECCRTSARKASEENKEKNRLDRIAKGIPETKAARRLHYENRSLYEKATNS